MGSLVNQTTKANNKTHATLKCLNSMSYFDFYFSTLVRAVFRTSTNVLLCFDGGSL